MFTWFEITAFDPLLILRSNQQKGFSCTDMLQSLTMYSTHLDVTSYGAPVSHCHIARVQQWFVLIYGVDYPSHTTHHSVKHFKLTHGISCRQLGHAVNLLIKMAIVRVND